jgi:hypothetical protein
MAGERRRSTANARVIIRGQGRKNGCDIPRLLHHCKLWGIILASSDINQCYERARPNHVGRHFPVVSNVDVGKDIRGPVTKNAIQ